MEGPFSSGREKTYRLLNSNNIIMSVFIVCFTDYYSL